MTDTTAMLRPRPLCKRCCGSPTTFADVLAGPVVPVASVVRRHQLLQACPPLGMPVLRVVYRVATAALTAGKVHLAFRSSTFSATSRGRQLHCCLIGGCDESNNRSLGPLCNPISKGVVDEKRELDDRREKLNAFFLRRFSRLCRVQLE